VPPGTFTGSHEKHSGGANQQYGYLCSYCHYNVGGTAYNHSTGYKNITGSMLPGASYVPGKKILTTNTNGTGACNNVTCHSTGRANRQFVTSQAWGSTTTTCLSCHGGRNSSTGAYSRNATNFTMSTTHQQHLGKYTSTQINCNHCHGKIAVNHTALKDYTGAKYHGNGSKNVLFSDLAYASYTSYKTGAGADQYKCTNTACHGGKTRSAWSNTGTVNTDNTCVHCHGVAGTSAALANSGANRRFFAPGYKVGATVGTSTDQIQISNNIRVGSHFKHLSSAYTKNIKCNECHTVPSTPFDGSHMAAKRFNSQTLTFTQASTATILKGVQAPSLPSRLAAFGGYTSGDASKAATCSSTYCHGSRLYTNDSSGSYRKPYWNYSAMVNYTNLTQACGRCHGNPPTKGSSKGLHSAYVAQPSVSCSGCHSMVVNPSGKIIDKALHINGQVNATSGHEWSFGGLKHKNGGTGSIKANPNSYSNCIGCHSLTGAGTYPVTRGVAANINCQLCHINQTNFTNTPGCGDCHGTNANGGQPNGTAVAFPNWSGSHGGHVTQMAYACDVCHINGGTGKAIHGNYSAKAAKTRATVNVGFNSLAGGTSTYSVGAMTCGTSNCHGKLSPVWGTRPSNQQCTICHGQANSGYINFSSALIAPGGAGRDTGGNTASSSPRVGSHNQHLTASSRLNGHKVHCGECHTVHTTVNDGTHLNYTTATISFGPLAKANGHSPTASRTNGIMNCSNVYCHHGKRPDGTGAGQRGSAPLTSWAFNGVTVLDNSTINGTCANKCHGFPPGAAVSGDQHFGMTVPTTVAGLASCSSVASGGTASGCHPSIKARAAGVPAGFTNLTSVFVAQGAMHINGSVEGGSCLGCHATHADTPGRRSIAGQFSSSRNSHHVQTATALDGKACYPCHWESDSGGSPTSYHGGSASRGAVVDLVVWNATTRPAAYTASVTAVTYQSGGTATSTRAEFAKINQHCLSCHNANNAAIQPFSASGDTSTPVKYAWDGLSVDARYSNTGTTPWGKFTGNDANTKSAQTKAFSAHGRATANPRGWTTAADTYTSATATSNVLCFDCHNSHGTSNNGTAITSSYSSATGRRKGGILKDTVANRGGYTVTYKALANATNGVKSVYNSGAGLCFDCHNTQTAAGSIPWGYSGTYGYTPPAGAATGVRGYNDTQHFGISATNTFPATVTYPYKAGKSTNAGGHFGASSAMTAAITKRAMDPGTPSGTVIQGLCTPCHDPHGVSTSLGTNQQYAVPLLKNTFVTSPYKQDLAPAATGEIRGGGSGQPQFAYGSTVVYYLDQRTFQAAVTGKPTVARSWNFNTSAATLQTLTDAQFGGLCTGCHVKTNISGAAATSTTWKTMSRIHNSVNGWAVTGGGNAGNIRHAYTCSKCHTAHNSRLPRLLVTNCLDVKHRGRVTTGGSMSAAQTGTGSRGSGIGRFPTGGYGAGAGTATNPGAWFFGTKGGNPTAIAQPCHNTSTAGGATYSTGGQLWNTKSPW